MKKIVLGVMTAMVLVSGAYCKSEIKEIKNTVIETITTTQKTGVKVVTTYSIPFSDFKQMQKNDANGSSTHTSWGLMETGYTKSGMYYEYLEIDPNKVECERSINKNIIRNICEAKQEVMK